MTTYAVAGLTPHFRNRSWIIDFRLIILNDNIWSSGVRNANRAAAGSGRVASVSVFVRVELQLSSAVRAGLQNILAGKLLTLLRPYTVQTFAAVQTTFTGGEFGEENDLT